MNFFSCHPLINGNTMKNTQLSKENSGPLKAESVLPLILNCQPTRNRLAM